MDDKPLVAWRTEWDGTESIVPATTRGRARQTTADAIYDAWGQRVWTAIRVRRAPEYDEWASSQPRAAAWREDIVAKLAQQGGRGDG